MKLLEDIILRDGKLLPGNILRVDNFLNHRIDVSLIDRLGQEFYRLFSDTQVDKILTVEASGIGIACMTFSEYFEQMPEKEKERYLGPGRYEVWKNGNLPLFLLLYRHLHTAEGIQIFHLRPHA